MCDLPTKNKNQALVTSISFKKRQPLHFLNAFFSEAHPSKHYSEQVEVGAFCENNIFLNLYLHIDFFKFNALIKDKILSSLCTKDAQSCFPQSGRNRLRGSFLVLFGQAKRTITSSIHHLIKGAHKETKCIKLLSTTCQISLLCFSSFP